MNAAATYHTNLDFVVVDSMEVLVSGNHPNTRVTRPEIVSFKTSGPPFATSTREIDQVINEEM